MPVGQPDPAVEAPLFLERQPLLARDDAEAPCGLRDEPYRRRGRLVPEQREHVAPIEAQAFAQDALGALGGQPLDRVSVDTQCCPLRVSCATMLFGKGQLRFARRTLSTRVPCPWRESVHVRPTGAGGLNRRNAAVVLDGPGRCFSSDQTRRRRFARLKRV